MKKIERDGKVAVLVSPRYGAGWSTWNQGHAETLCMDADIVQAVLDGDRGKAAAVAEAKCPDIYTGGSIDLTIEWVNKGVRFRIEEYDGYETLHIFDPQEYFEA